MQMNLFGFKMLDSIRTGQIYTTDIADMTQNALANCPEVVADRAYPSLIGS